MDYAELIAYSRMCLEAGMPEHLVQEMHKRVPRINSTGGPAPKDYETVSAFLFELERTKLHGVKLSTLMEPLFITPYREWSNAVETGYAGRIGQVRPYYHFMLHIWDKPFGYNGDGALLRKMYEAHETEVFNEKGEPWSSHMSSNWDKYIMARPEMTGLQQRKAIFHTIMDRWFFQWPTKSEPVRVLDIGCGDGAYMKEVSEIASGQRVNLDITGVDQDQRSLDYAIAHNLAPSAETSLSVGYIGGNALDLLRKAPTADIVYATGLFDYFSDALFERVLKLIWQTGAKKILIGNINQSIRTRATMSLLGWNLFDRRTSRLSYLAENALFQLPCVIGTASDFTETQNFLTIERKS